MHIPKNNNINNTAALLARATIDFLKKSTQSLQSETLAIVVGIFFQFGLLCMCYVQTYGGKFIKIDNEIK